MASRNSRIMQSTDGWAQSRQQLPQTGKTERTHGIMAVANLHPSMREWTIKGQVTRKGERTRFRYERGEGIVFSFDLLDAMGGRIQCTCYNTMANRYYDKIHTGRTYLVSNGDLKPYQRQSALVNSEWEITLGSSSSVEPCTSFDILQHDYNPTAETPMSNKLFKKMDDVAPAVLMEEPKTPHIFESRRAPISYALSLKNSDGPKTPNLHPELHDIQSQDMKKPQGEERKPSLLSHQNHLMSQLLPQASKSFTQPLAPASKKKPADHEVEVTETGCGDNDVWDDTDSEWIGGPGEPVDPSSYRWIRPTGWD